MARKPASDGTEHRLQQNISCFAFNGDYTKIALSPNDNNILIYDIPGGDVTTTTDKWELQHTLSQHDSFVSGVDWSPVTDLIVSSGHDRNAYVWKWNPEKQEWDPTLVILRINRAANCVRWTPDGNKFAVGSGARQVPVCHYEPGNNWWVSKMIKKKLKSSILTLAWHPNSKFLLLGGSDMKCRIYSAFISEVDSTDDEEDFENIFKKQFKFGELLQSFDNPIGWVEGVSWSPNGFRAVFCAHDSSISFVQILEGADPMVQILNFKDLPFKSVEFISDDAVVAVGHECNPFLFKNGGTEAEPEWKMQEKLDKEGKGDQAKKKKVVNKFAGAMSMFQETSNQGKKFKGAAGAIGPTVLKTRHQNQITELNVLWEDRSEKTTCARLMTAGSDGRLLMWDLAALKIAGY